MNENLSAIKQLYLGKRGYVENIPTSEKYFDLIESVIKCENEIFEKFNNLPEFKELYAKTENAIDDLHFESCFQNFSEGFRFGLLLGLDILNPPVEKRSKKIRSATLASSLRSE